MNRVDGKIAVVTGGTQGLGEAIAKAFASVGAAGIIICGRNTDKGKKVLTELKSKFGIKCDYVRADLKNVKDCRLVIRRADELFGRVDLLVNAAGVTDRGNLLNTSEELFDTTFAVNTKAPFFLMQESVKIMIREKVEGSIINIGSIAALTGQPFIAPYCASKGALATLTRNSAYALLRNRIRVNQLNIGWMASEGEDRIQKAYHDADDNWLKEASAKLPFGRLIEPEEIAKAVCFLASNDSGLMTGSVINFDQSVWGGCSSSPPTPERALKF
ncbi:MAG: SDR family oxidoreductase [Pseudomonadota bacterium]|nr:SDR family oxidoreductase [Pseudomonadota bacterium]